MSAMGLTRSLVDRRLGFRLVLGSKRHHTGPSSDSTPYHRMYLEAPYHPSHLATSRRGTWGNPLSGMLGKLWELPSKRGSIHWVEGELFFRAEELNPPISRQHRFPSSSFIRATLDL